MTRNDFYAEILPSTILKSTLSTEDKSAMVLYKNKDKDISFIKKVAREKVIKDGAPIKYYRLREKEEQIFSENILKDQHDLTFYKPISFNAVWTPQEFQMDLGKWGIMMPDGSDQQLYLHVDDIDEYIERKPTVGDIIETLYDKTRYKIADVFYGNMNLWENIYCMVTLTKIQYDNFTAQLDDFDASYKETYTRLENVLDLMDGSEELKSNNEIQETKKKTNSTIKKNKRTIETSLDLMTMSL